MWPDWVTNAGPLTYESGALPTALCGLAGEGGKTSKVVLLFMKGILAEAYLLYLML